MVVPCVCSKTSGKTMCKQNGFLEMSWYRFSRDGFFVDNHFVVRPYFFKKHLVGHEFLDVSGMCFSQDKWRRITILRIVFVFFVQTFWAPHIWFPSWHFVSHLQLFTYFSSLHKHHDSYSSFEFLSLSIRSLYSIFTTSSVSHVFNFLPDVYFVVNLASSFSPVREA